MTFRRGPGRRRVPLFVTGALVVGLGMFAVVAWFPAGTVHIDFPVNDGGLCDNYLFADGDGWVPTEGRPQGDPITGTFSFRRNSGELVQPDGTRVSYRRWTSSKWMPCIAQTIG